MLRRRCWIKRQALRKGTKASSSFPLRDALSSEHLRYHHLRRLPAGLGPSTTLQVPNTVGRAHARLGSCRLPHRICTGGHASSSSTDRLDHQMPRFVELDGRISPHPPRRCQNYWPSIPSIGPALPHLCVAACARARADRLAYGPDGPTALATYQALHIHCTTLH
jgi:hypothetical protein